MQPTKVADQRRAFRKREPVGSEQREGKIERRRQAACTQVEGSLRGCAEWTHGQGEPVEQRRHAPCRMHAFNEPERSAVGADQQVLSVVECNPGQGDAPCTAADDTRLLEQRHANAGLGKFDRRGAARPAATDDGDGDVRFDAGRQGRRAVFHAIQSLRSGVSAIRCDSTS